MTPDQHADHKSGKVSGEQVLRAAGRGSINVMARLQETAIMVMTFSRQLRNV